MMGRAEKNTLQQMEELSRTRPLTDSEVRRLEWALSRRAEKAKDWYWSRADILRLRRHLLNGKKPAQISVVMKRTERAIWRKMNLLGWTVKAATIWVINPEEAP